MDLIALSRGAGFTIKLEDEVALPFIAGTVEIATPMVRSRDFDFATADINRQMKAHMLKYALKIPSVRPPTEGIMFYRALGGLIQDLQNLKARGDFRKVYEEMAALLPA